MLPCAKKRNLHQVKPHGYGDVGEAEVGIEGRRATAADCVQLASFPLVSQKHHAFQELDAQTK